MKESASREHWKERLGSGTWEVNRRTVSIAGQVTDVRTGRSINGIQVTAASRTTSFVARTRNDGHFHFLDLPDGEYSLTVLLRFSGSRFDTAEINATTFHNVNGNIEKLTNNNIASTGNGVLIIKLKT